MRARSTSRPRRESLGRVERIADGIALVSGLPEARLNELLRFEGGRMGFALSLEADTSTPCSLDEARRSRRGSLVIGDR